MLRRAGVGAATLLAGCTGGGSSDEPADGDDPPVSATWSVGGGLTPTPWEHRVTVTEDGRLSFLFLCPNSDERTTAEAELSPEEHAAFERTVRDLDVSALEDEYTCGDQCPTDLPSTQLTVHVGDRTREIWFYAPPPGTVPEGLVDLLGRLRSYADRFEYDCTQTTDSPDG